MPSLPQVYTVVDEMFLAGEIRETSQAKVLKQLLMLQSLEVRGGRPPPAPSPSPGLACSLPFGRGHFHGPLPQLARRKAPSWSLGRGGGHTSHGLGAQLWRRLPRVYTV